jgi:hypothetical protein
MENKDALLIRKYMTLMESIDKKLTQPEDDSKEKGQLDEENPYVELARGGKLAASELEGAFKAMKADSKLTKDLALIRTNEELLVALKLNKVTPAVKGAMELHFLKSGTANTKLIEAAAEALTKNNLFRQKYAKDMLAGQVQFEKALKTAGYSDRAITSIVAKTKNLRPEELEALAKEYEKSGKGGKTGPKEKETIPGKKDPVTPPGPKDPGFMKRLEDWRKKWGDKLKEQLKGGKNWKSIVKWGLGLGIPLAILYWMVKDSGETVPDDTPVTPPVDGEWMACVQKLIDDKSGEIVSSTDGTYAGVMVKSDEYPEGVIFYTNGRVMNVKTRDMGTYKCKEGTVQQTVTEQGTASEIDLSTMSGYVDTAVDDLDGLVVTYNLNSLMSIMNNLKGKTYKGKNAIAEFLRLYSADEGGDSFIADVESVGVKTLGVEAIELKNDIIELAKGATSTTTTTDKKGSLGGIEITWDGSPKPTDKPTPGPSDGPQPTKAPKTTFTDCTDLPFIYGCKSPKIKEMQKCLGLESKYQTGNLGSKTKSAVDNWAKEHKMNTWVTIRTGGPVGAKAEWGVGEELYNAIIKECNPTTGSTVTPTGSTVTPTGSTVTPTGSTVTPTGSTVTPTGDTQTQGGGTTVSEKTQQEIRSNIQKRVLGGYVYKGRDLNPAEQEYLKGYMKERGYGKFIPKEKMGPNDKYVFKKLR